MIDFLTAVTADFGKFVSSVSIPTLNETVNAIKDYQQLIGSFVAGGFAIWAINSAKRGVQDQIRGATEGVFDQILSSLTLGLYLQQQEDLRETEATKDHLIFALTGQLFATDARLGRLELLNQEFETYQISLPKKPNEIDKLLGDVDGFTSLFCKEIDVANMALMRSVYLLKRDYDKESDGIEERKEKDENFKEEIQKLIIWGSLLQVGEHEAQVFASRVLHSGDKKRLGQFLISLAQLDLLRMQMAKYFLDKKKKMLYTEGINLELFKYALDTSDNESKLKAIIKQNGGKAFDISKLNDFSQLSNQQKMSKNSSYYENIAPGQDPDSTKAHERVVDHVTGIDKSFQPDATLTDEQNTTNRIDRQAIAFLEMIKQAYKPDDRVEE